LVLALLFSFTPGGPFDPAGCPSAGPPDQNAGLLTIEQGALGNVWFWQGDFMPAEPSGCIRPVVRELRIHHLTTEDQAVRHGDSFSFYEAVHSPLITRVTSNARGFFEVELPPGRYSLFAVEGGLLYANGFGDDGIWPFTVRAGEVTELQFDIDYLATS